MYQTLKVIIILIICNLNCIVLSNTKDSKDILRIVYVMTTIPGSCGPFQDYFKQVLLQAKSSQMLSEEKKLTEVILLSNFKQCRWSLHDLRNGEVLELRNISTIESHAIKSLRTLEFEKLFKKIVPKGHEIDLTLTSIYRYFMLEDYMKNYTVNEVLHMDNDKMIYEDLYHLLPILRTSYPNLGCVPHVHKRFISSSTLWIGNLQSLTNFNNFLLSLGRNNSGEFNQYTSWLREFACCRSIEQGGIFPDDQGRGIKLWGLNDMTMLAYYHFLHKNELKLFPILPKIDFEQKHLVSDSNIHKVYVNPELDPTPSDTTTSSSSSSSSAAAVSASINTNNINNNHDQHHRHDLNTMNLHHHANISLYAVGGYDVGSDLGALFDSSQGGYGDHFHHIKIGATKEASAIATRLIIEQAFLRYNCSISMKCGSSKSYPSNCYMKPFVHCGNDKFTPLLTMHAFRTHPTQYRSTSCKC